MDCAGEMSRFGSITSLPRWLHVVKRTCGQRLPAGPVEPMLSARQLQFSGHPGRTKRTAAAFQLDCLICPSRRSLVVTRTLGQCSKPSHHLPREMHASAAVSILLLASYCAFGTSLCSMRALSEHTSVNRTAAGRRTAAAPWHFAPLVYRSGDSPSEDETAPARICPAVEHAFGEPDHCWGG